MMDGVVFGTTVVLYNDAEDKEITYQIVGEDEADIKAGKISISSPVAMALIGKEVHTHLPTVHTYTYSPMHHTYIPVHYAHIYNYIHICPLYTHIHTHLYTKHT